MWRWSWKVDVARTCWQLAGSYAWGNGYLPQNLCLIYWWLVTFSSLSPQVWNLRDFIFHVWKDRAQWLELWIPIDSVTWKTPIRRRLFSSLFCLPLPCLGGQFNWIPHSRGILSSHSFSFDQLLSSHSCFEDPTSVVFIMWLTIKWIKYSENKEQKSQQLFITRNIY